MRETDRQTERERREGRDIENERETDSQRESDRERQTEPESQRKRRTDRQTDRARERQRCSSSKQFYLRLWQIQKFSLEGCFVFHSLFLPFFRLSLLSFPSLHVCTIIEREEKMTIAYLFVPLYLFDLLP